MKSYFLNSIKWCMVLSIIIQSRGGIFIEQVAYADGIPLTLSRSDSVADGLIAPYQTNMTGLSFMIDSPTENLTYNGLTIYAVNQGGTSCSSTGDIESIATQVQLYQDGLLLGSDSTVSATGVDSCIYEIPFTNTLASGSHYFDVMFDTTGTTFNPDGSTISFVVDNTSFPGLQTDMGTGVATSDISGGPADGADFTTQNPGLALIEKISTGASQVSYNNGYLTGFAISITSKSVSDVILSGFVVGQIGTNKFGSGGHNVPHTITLLDASGSTLATTTINETGEIIFENLNYLIPAGQTGQLHMMVSWTGDIVANNFQFQGSYWDVYDTSGHAYPYPTSISGLPIDILENTVTALKSAPSDGGLVVNDINGIYVGQIRFNSTTPSSIQQIALININEPFSGNYVDSGTLACSSSSACDNISTGGDGLEVYLMYSGQVVGSGIIMSGAVTIPMMSPISIYDQGEYIDIYVYDLDGIQQSDETNRIITLGLLNTQNILDLGGHSVETIIKADSNNNDLIANFDDHLMIYEQHRIRKSLLSVVVDPALSGYSDIDNVMFQTGVSLLGIQLQSTGSTSYLYQIIFTHTSNNVQVDNFGLIIDGDSNSDNSDCTLNTGFVTCTMTGSYINGFPIDLNNHSIILTADITGSVATGGESISTSLINAIPADYRMYDVNSIPVQHSLIYSDGSDPSLTTSSINWFTDAGVSLSNISLEYNVSGGEVVAEPIIITGISYQHTGSQYSFMWDSYQTGYVAISTKSISTGGYVLQDTSAASGGISSIINIGITDTYDIKFTPVTSTGVSLGPDQIITLHHTGSTATIFLNGNADITVDLGGFFLDPGAYRDDGSAQSSEGIIVSGSVNTNILGTYLITYDYTDIFGNPAVQVVRTVRVQDITAPVITISGSNPAFIEFGGTYTDSGATATDNSTGAIIELVGSGTVDTMNVGDYYINYEYTDPSGNTGSALRTVTVQDTTPPTLQFIGDETTTIGYNGTFNDLGALWTDNRDGTGIVYTTDTVPNILGTHLVVYTYQDQAGNVGTITGAVRVVDNTIPVITRNGAEFINHEAGTPYVDSGAIYNDDVAGVGSITASGSVDVWTTGVYLLTYDYTDPSGNTGVQQTRTVTVQDTTAPAISVIGSTGMVILLGGTYSESGATWTDLMDGSGSTLVSGTVDTNTLGTYYIEYYYVDNAGNTGSAIRTIDITDQTPPSLSLNGDSIVSVYSGSIYIESGATWTDNVDGSGTISPTSGSVNTNLTGTYILEYQKIDNAGNIGSINRIVHVVDLPFCMTTNVPQIECEALIALYNSTDGANWTNNSGWGMDTDVENWYGVDILGGVDSLHLANNSLSGSLPDKIGDLTGLKILELQMNSIGGVLPDQLSNLSNLTTLNVGANNLSGEIPGNIRNMINLETLTLGGNNFYGELSSSLGNLTKLTSLSIGGNNLSGSIPEEIGNLTNLRFLGLSPNQFSGSLPNSIGNLTGLRELSAYSGGFEGVIPSSISNLKSLYYLSLFNNNFSGSIEFITGMTNLQFLYLENNSFRGEIPYEIGNLTNLSRVNLNDNHLNGLVPTSIENLNFLQEIHLYNNQLIADSGYNAILPAGLKSKFIASGVMYQLRNNLYLPPTITLNGSDIVNQSLGSSYTDPHAIYYNAIDGSTGIVYASGSVNTAQTGSYLLTYDYTDIYGNSATQQTRTVAVADTTIHLAPVGYVQYASGSDSYTITWNAGSGYNVDIFIKDASSSGDYIRISTILGTLGSGNINLYTGATYMVKLTPVDDLSTPLGPDQIMTITHTAPLTTTPYRSIGGGGSSKHTTIVNENHSTGSTQQIGTTGTSDSGKKDDSKTTASDNKSSQPITIKIGTNGEIIIIDPSKMKGPMFAKDLPRSTGLVASGSRDHIPLTLKPYSIITPEMLTDISLIEEGDTSWDHAPRNYQAELDRRLRNQGTWDRDSSISSNFFKKLLSPIVMIFRY